MGCFLEKVLQQPLQIIEFEPRPVRIAEPAAQFLEHAPRPLYVDLARHLDGEILAVFARAHRAAQRVGALRRTRLVAHRLAHAVAHPALHRFGEALRALAEILQGAALLFDRAFGVAALQRAFGVAHGLTGLPQRLAGVLTGTVFFAAVAVLTVTPQLLEHLFEPLPQALLILLEVVVGAALAIAGLGVRRTVAPLSPALAPLAEGFIAQALLLLDHAAEFVELAHSLIGGIGARLLAAAQAVEHRLHLVEQTPGGVARAVARKVLDAVEHVLEILRPDDAGVAIERPIVGRAVAAQLIGERAHKSVEHLAHLVGQAADFIVAGAALERLAQRVLRRAQFALGVGHGAVLDEHGDFPQIVNDRAKIVVAFRELEPRQRRTQAEIDRGFRRELLGRDHQRAQRLLDILAGVGVEREVAALLDQRAGKELAERPFGQANLARLAHAFVAAFVARDERQNRADARPRVLGQVAGGLTGSRARARLRQ